MNIISLIRRLTVEQWAAIDTEYRAPGVKTDAKGIGVLVLSAVLLTVKRYYGRTRGFEVMFGGVLIHVTIAWAMDICAIVAAL